MANKRQEINILQHYLLPEVRISETETGYIAGILDAGGSFRVSKLSGRPSYCMQVVYRNRRNVDVINTIAKLFDANLKLVKGGATDIKDFEVTFTSRKAYRLLKQIHPFLRIKKELAECCMEFLELYWRPPSTQSVEPERQRIGEEYAKKCKKLYMKSWPRPRIKSANEQ